ncbi:sensor histidine kinase [Lewinella cohaerens]|uniref:sensor histidine kinase n=1 Tax=Lewinella cohaerens TaxID=70995 RepID=UPI00037C4E3E|nr:HAMP domain-containing sensor histidine kinase [Lewinella cohaerens]
MDIYQRKSRQKWYLAILGLVIILFSIWYTSYMAERLAVVEQNNTRFYAIAQEDLSTWDNEAQDYCDYTLHSEILLSNTMIPVIIVNESGGVDWGANWGSEERDTNKVYLQKKMQELIEDGAEPIEGYGTLLYFGESKILTQLRYFPVVQFLLIGGFIVFGYIGLNSARRSEQNRVWVGMAKETAHQLGTPISAIVAWIEHLKILRPEDEETMEVVEELRNDVQRLELIADRFSKIGSVPKLDQVNIYEELGKCKDYMQRRASRKVKFDFPDPMLNQQNVAINPPLFEWVIENLLRNALDAMGSKGEISAEVYEDSQFVFVDITDSGKGIPASNHKRVFQPGFTTKKRGWGLGLSLTKRIIEDYHGGKIFVKRSEEGKGTTFTISLPKQPAK